MPAAIWAQRGAGGVEHGDGVGCREGEDVLDLGRVCGVYVCVAGVYGGDYDEGVHHAAFEESFSEGWWERVRGLAGEGAGGRVVCWKGWPVAVCVRGVCGWYGRRGGTVCMVFCCIRSRVGVRIRGSMETSLSERSAR